MTWPDDSVYEGAFADGKPEGKGVKRSPNGNVYDGLWANGEKHGHGKQYNAKTGTWTAEDWRDGKKWSWNKNNEEGATASPTNRAAKLNPVFGRKAKAQVREEGWAR